MSEELTEEERRITRRANFLEGWERGFRKLRSQFARDCILGSDDPDMEMVCALDEAWEAIETAGGPNVYPVLLAVTSSWKEGREYERKKVPHSVPQVWASGEPVDPATQIRFLLLRQAGCKCQLPLLGNRTVRNHEVPRCRSCSAVADLDPGQWPDIRLVNYLRDAGLVTDYGRPRKSW